MNEIIIEKTTKNLKNSLILNLVYLGCFALLCIAEIVFIALDITNKVILSISSSLLVLFWILYIINIVYQSRYNSKKFLPAKVEDDKLILNSGESISLNNVKTINFSKFKNNSYGTLKIKYNESKTLKLYYVEDIENINQLLNERLTNK